MVFSCIYFPENEIEWIQGMLEIYLLEFDLVKIKSRIMLQYIILPTHVICKMPNNAWISIKAPYLFVYTQLYGGRILK